MTDILFEFYRGDTYSRDFTIKGWSLPISNVYFTAKENINNKKACLQKTLNNGITLVEETEEERTFNLNICCTDTDCLKVDTDYVFDIEIHSETGEGTVKRTIVTGILRLKASATRTCNEV
jgi:hypothetical protein